MQVTKHVTAYNGMLRDVIEERLNVGEKINKNHKMLDDQLKCHTSESIKLR